MDEMDEMLFLPWSLSLVRGRRMEKSDKAWGPSGFHGFARVCVCVYKCVCARPLDPRVQPAGHFVGMWSPPILGAKSASEHRSTPFSRPAALGARGAGKHPLAGSEPEPSPTGSASLLMVSVVSPRACRVMTQLTAPL